MENFTLLSDDAIKNINGGQHPDFLETTNGDVLMGYPGQSLVNFIWGTLKAAYQKGYDDKISNHPPCT